MPPYDDRRLWPGTVPPAAGAPRRHPGSVRRTSSVDLVRPEGFEGPLVVTGRARDLATGADGAATTFDVATTEVVVDYLGGRVIRTVAADPAPAGLQGLVGARAGSGFRRALAEALPELADDGGLVHLLLDELTPTTLISGSVYARDGGVPPPGGPQDRLPVDICAGWASGGAMLAAVAETGVPLLGWGPPAPSLDRRDDPDAWHAMADLPPRSMRRRRLLDVRPAPDDADELLVAVRFRDSYWEPDGTETVVHEYGLALVLDARSWTITAVEAVPGPLPAPECPSAVASAQRLVGRGVDGLRDAVRSEFSGVRTCTHLNDVFRSLADLRHLWLAAAPAR